ncbi:RQC domain-containing protein [Ammoniphilus sp. CFH 90114]|uniref:RQC domain-containing protein n=1 Tax=Ammoniphilus sp. CFH 90114 TaxID=2493665 RepID=UPI001F0C47DA|nr:RQC domain-containing protein [Ammoniphilus sp. CFH 90114]
MQPLTQEEIRIILRAADSIIATGGRTLLSKILKGSREKKVLELELQSNPSYGLFHSITLDEIMKKIAEAFVVRPNQSAWLKCRDCWRAFCV